jgi:arylsulfatase
MTSFRGRALAIVLFLGALAAALSWWRVSRRPLDVVIVVGDCLRADRCGAGAKGSLTPFLDRLAKEGTGFTRAYAASSWTLPSIASLATSRYPSQHGVNTYDAVLRDDEVTLNDRLREAGYYQAGFTANFRLDAAHGFAQGYTAWFPFIPDSSELLAKTRGAKIVTDAVAFVDDVLFAEWGTSGRHPPFLFYFHFMEPHGPYLPPSEQAAATALGGDRAQRLNEALMRYRWSELDADDVAALAALYDGEVAAFDTAVRDLFAALERRGLLRNALVIVTADHGEEFREHGQLTHGVDLYEELVHVPLLLRGPGIDAGRVVDVPVSLVDVAPTILDLLGLPPEPRFVGRSLAALLRGEPARGADVLTELLPLGAGEVDRSRHRAALIRGAHKVIAERHPDGAAVGEAYDLALDPHERNPIAADTGLASALEERLERLSRQAPPPARQPLDEATRQRLRALGYLVEVPPTGEAPAR